MILFQSRLFSSALWTMSNGRQHSQTKDASTTNAFLSGTLDFLANASKETLIACYVALAAVLYMVFGRVGLLLIGIITGAIAHGAPGSAWHGDRTEHGSTSLDLARRSLAWQDDKIATGQAGDAGPLETAAEHHAAPEISCGPATKVAVENLQEAVIRDYVRSVSKAYGPS